MKFTVLSHACLYVEGDGGSVLIDPWIIGTCYWRSWWNFPEPPPALLDSLKPDYIYITHLHWDHFHGPSLRRFDYGTKLLVPKIPSDRMVRDLRMCRFENVQEIPHGASVELWPGTRLYAYQFGPCFTDSAVVVTDGRTTILDCNDCKVFGYPLKQITRKFPKIDFVLRSHSSASALPYCVEGYLEKFPEIRTQQAYIEEFANFCFSVGARYGIPFASNHCFLHRETERYNDTVVNPAMVEKHMNRRAEELGLESRCVVMPSGSSWSDTEGFSIKEFDYSRIKDYLAELRSKYQDKLQATYDREDRTRASYQAFEKYFTKMLKSIPGVLRKRLFPRVMFEAVEHDGVKHWLVDFRHRVVKELAEPVPVDFTIRCHAIVLNDCVRKYMFSSWAAAKRLKIITDGDDFEKLGFFMEMLDYFENDGLPLRRNFSPRQLGVRIRRWREAAEALRLLFKHKVLRKPFVVADLYQVKAARAA